MSDFTTTVPNLVIPISTDTSNAVSNLDDANTLTIYSPDTLTGTVRVQVSYDGVTYYDLKSAGSNVTVPVDAAVVITDVAYSFLRLFSSGNEAAARTFIIRKQFSVR